MSESSTKVATEEEALNVWFAQDGMVDKPARGSTEETEIGWRFYNVNGYLGTVTTEGDVIEETNR